MSAILSSLVGPVTGLLDKFIEDKDQKNALAHEIATMSERHAQELATVSYTHLTLPTIYSV